MNILLITILISASIYDLKYKIIPNYISLLVLLAGFLFGKIYFNGILVAIIILTICVIYDENYKGGGDIKLLGALGIATGFINTFYIYIISDILVLIFRVVHKKVLKKEILEVSYAPFILITMSILTLIE